MYKTLGPFRFWCQKVLPLIYDDSLSYYELLCKVIKYLNDINANVDGLNDLVNQLYEFVNNYFDNLDVQDEINKKLDEMAKSGVLTELLNKLFYTPQRFGAKGDGVTDDTQAFKSMLAAAPENSVILIKDGTFLIDTFATCNRPGEANIKKALTIRKNNITIIGNAEIIVNVPRDSYFYLIFSVIGSNITFDGITFRSLNQQCRYVPIALNVEWDQEIPLDGDFYGYRIKNCNFYYPFITASFTINNDEVLNNLTLHDVIYENNYAVLSTSNPSGGLDVHSIGTNRLSNVIMRGNIIHGGNNFSSLNCVTVKNVTIANNIAQGNTFAGCQIENECEGVVIANNQFIGCSRGIWLDDDVAVVNSNVFTGNTTDLYVTIGHEKNIDDDLLVVNNIMNVIGFSYIGDTTGYTLKKFISIGNIVNRFNMAHCDMTIINNTIINSLTVYRNQGGYIVQGGEVDDVTAISGSNPCFFLGVYNPNNLTFPGSYDLLYNGIDYMTRSNQGIAIMCGRGAPTTYMGKGSLYQRFDGDKNTTLYVQTASQEWTPVSFG